MNQEYKIVEFRIDLKEQDRSVFLPVGAQILDVYYEVGSVDAGWITAIGSIDRLQQFNHIKQRMKGGAERERIGELIKEYGMAHFPLECLEGDVRLVIKALVPAPKPKGKYA